MERRVAANRGKPRRVAACRGVLGPSQTPLYSGRRGPRRRFNRVERRVAVNAACRGKPRQAAALSDPTLPGSERASEAIQ